MTGGYLNVNKYFVTTDGSLDSEDNVDTGFDGVVMMIGVVTLAGAAVVVSRKRK